MADSTGGDTRIDPIEAWLRAAVADADRRGLPELKPLLEGLARSTRQLRAAEWNGYVPADGRRPTADGGATASNRQEKAR
jgi:hypothetical protein